MNEMMLWWNMARKGSGRENGLEKVKEIPSHFQRMEMLNASRTQHLEHGFSSKWHQYASACNVQVHNSIQCANERYNGTFYSRLTKNWVWEIELLLHALGCRYVCVSVRPSVHLSLYFDCGYFRAYTTHSRKLNTTLHTHTLCWLFVLAKWTKVKLLNFTVHFRVHVLQYICAWLHGNIKLQLQLSHFSSMRADFTLLNSVISICKYWKFVSIKFLLNELKQWKLQREYDRYGRNANAFSSQTALNESYKLLN